MRCRLEQERGLAANDLHILGFIDIEVANTRQLQNLAFGDGVRRIRQDGENIHIVEIDHQLESPRVEKIAHEHGRRVAPEGIGRCTPTTQV